MKIEHPLSHCEMTVINLYICHSIQHKTVANLHAVIHRQNSKLNVVIFKPCSLQSQHCAGETSDSKAQDLIHWIPSLSRHGVWCASLDVIAKHIPFVPFQTFWRFCLQLPLSLGDASVSLWIQKNIWQTVRQHCQILKTNHNSWL